MPGFTESWFRNLADITEEKVNIAIEKGIVHYAPDLTEMYKYGLVPYDFYYTAIQLLETLKETPYPMTYFRVYVSHIYTYPQDKAFRWQANIAFTADETYHARIGVGFRISPSYERSVDDYLSFRQKVEGNKEGFNRVFEELGSYSEPEHIFNGSGSLSENVLSDNDWGDSWRFYGRDLRYDAPEDREILESVDKFAEEAVRVFELIDKAGFLYG